MRICLKAVDSLQAAAAGHGWKVRDRVWVIDPLVAVTVIASGAASLLHPVRFTVSANARTITANQALRTRNLRLNEKNATQQARRGSWGPGQGFCCEVSDG